LGSLVVSLSNGNICVIKPIEGTGLSVIDTWHAHDHEPWVAAWDYWNTDVIYSGLQLSLRSHDIYENLSSEKVATI